MSRVKQGNQFHSGLSSVPNKYPAQLSRDQPTSYQELQESHLRSIIGQPVNSIQTADPRNQGSFGSQIQIPLSQKRQGTGQKVIDNKPHQPTFKSSKALPQSSSGYGNQGRIVSSKYEEIIAGRTNSVYAGIPKPTVQSAVSRQTGAQQATSQHANYNSTSAAGYQSKLKQQQEDIAKMSEYQNIAINQEVRDSVNHNNRNLLQNLQGKSKKKFNEGATSNKLKAAGAASLQNPNAIKVDRELHSDLGSFHNQPPQATNTQPSAYQKFSQNMQQQLPSGRAQYMKNQFANNNPLLPQIAQNFQKGNYIGRESISTDKQQAQTPNLPPSTSGGTASQVHLIYGAPTNQTVKPNRNQKKNLANQQASQVSQNGTKVTNEISSTPTNVLTEGNKPYSSSNKQIRRIGQTGVSVDSKKGIAFRHAYKDLAVNRNPDGTNIQQSRNISPKNELKSQINNQSQINLQMQPVSNDRHEQTRPNAMPSLGAAATSSRSKIQNNFLGNMGNSHSNKKLPTWKGSLIEGSRLSQAEQINMKERSLDRVNSKKLLANAQGNGQVVQSRHELLQNNYKKVIQNHPSTIGTGNDQYDDTDFLNKMFSKDNNDIQRRDGLNNYESSEVLHKSESQQMLLDYNQRNQQKKRAIGTSSSPRKESKVIINSKPNLAPSSRIIKDRSSGETSKGKINTLSAKTNKDKQEEFPPTSMFSLLGELPIGGVNQENVLLDDDVRKLDRLMLINASARYELITANAMLIDFHLNRVLRAKGKAKATRAAGSPNNQAFSMRHNDLSSDVIGELPEAEDLYTNKKNKKKFESSSKDPIKSIIDIGNQVSALAGQLSSNLKNNNQGALEQNYKSSANPKKGEMLKANLDPHSVSHSEPFDKARESIFGTLQFSGLHEYDTRIKLMQDPHHLMQQRLNDMNPLMFGDTIRLPVLHQP